MELTKQQLKEAIEIAIRVRDKCQYLEEKDALALLINTAEELIQELK